MKNKRYILGVALALGFVACDKTGDNPIPEGENGVISFAPKSVETRALVNNVTDLQSQTLKIWDIWSGQTDPYIDNTLEYTPSGWLYGTDNTYYWEDGTHKFFSYTNGAGTFTNNKLFVSKTLTTAEANQVDILFSDIFTTTAATWKSAEGHTPNTPVPLDFKHLLTSVAFVVKNGTDNDVVVNSVKDSIPNIGSATVDFSGTVVSVDYGAVTAGTSLPVTFAGILVSDLTLSAGDSLDVLNQKDVPMALADYEYYLTWPRTFEEGGVKVKLSYTMGGTPYDKVVSIPATTWKRGNKNTYSLVILPTDIRLKFDVMPWDEGEAGSINTSNGSINMSNVTWMNTNVKVAGKDTTTVVNNDYLVNMFYKPTVNGETYTANHGYYPAMGYFTVNYPVSGLYKIVLIPAYGESTVDEDAYEIVVWNGSAFRALNPNGEIITNETVYFQVRATGIDTAAHKAQIDILFKPTGSDEWISAYSEVRANYALTIPAR